MNSNIRLLIFLVVFLSSCQKREWNNPFDSSCPKEIWTPTNFNAVQEGTTVKLTWNQPINQISGFKIQKGVGGGSNTSMPDQSKGINLLVDNSLIGGKVHLYSLTTYAGNNTSNTVTAQVTPILAAGITTTAVSSITSNSVSTGGTITTDGGASITARGVCWSTNQNPTIANSKTSDGTGAVSFVSNLTGLAANTTYYVRAYAINSQGTAYGNEVSFKTAPGGTAGTITDIDGNIYHTVTIGTQVWMVENLKTTKFNDGSPIPNVIDNLAWQILSTPGYCWHNNDETTYKNTYGALYNWYAVNTRRLCPIGWHVPSDAEWTTLTTYLGGESLASDKLREVGTSHWLNTNGLNPNIGATNETGFTALPGGYRIFDGGGVDGAFWNFGSYGYWWASTEFSTGSAKYRAMSTGISTVGGNGYGAEKYCGLSVRCLKD